MNEMFTVVDVLSNVIILTVTFTFITIWLAMGLVYAYNKKTKNEEEG